jgi:hypothetical protein
MARAISTVVYPTVQSLFSSAILSSVQGYFIG